MAFVGPQISTSLRQCQSTNDSETEHFQPTEHLMIGPVLPSSFVAAENIQSVGSLTENASEIEIYGPTLPPDMRDNRNDGKSAYSNDFDDDDITIGPVPSCSNAESKDQYEGRLELLRFKQKLASREQKREEWMTELPSQLKSYGLEARGFRIRVVDANQSTDRSAWTDSPSDRLLKSTGPHAKETQQSKLSKRSLPNNDEECEKIVKKLNVEKESLLEVHKKIMKDANKDSGDGRKERIPFDRDKDLKVEGLRDVDKMSIIQNAKDLGSRFSHGSKKFNT